MSDLIFSREAIQRHIDKALGDVPTGHGYAKLKVTLDGEVSIMTAARVHDHWMVQGRLAYHLRDKLLSGEVEVIASW